MKLHLMITCLLLFSGVTFSQAPSTFIYKISKPYCVFNFMQTAVYHHSTSSTLRDTIERRTNGNAAFNQLCNDFASIRYDYGYKRDEFPEKRRQNRSTSDVIANALVHSDDFETFKDRITGILPISETEKLVDVLKEAEKIYDEIIWNESAPKISAQIKELEKYTSQCASIFQRISRFYNSGWPSDVPFVVTLYPIPGASGNSTATPYGNSLCIGVLTGETDYIGRLGVVLHEMNHVLYDEQSAAFQHTLDSYFRQNTSPYSTFAYTFFDEALATALGNGWAYHQLSGETDPNDWYNHTIIDGFGKAIYPLVAEYLEQEKQIDQAFIDASIALFGTTFPSSITNYEIVLNNLFFYINSEPYTEIKKQINLLGDHFQFSGLSTSSPIMDPTALNYLESKEGTHLILIDEQQQATFRELKKHIPELRKVKLKSSSVVCFGNNNNQTIIVLYASKKEDVPHLYEFIKKQKNYDPGKLIQFQM